MTATASRAEPAVTDVAPPQRFDYVPALDGIRAIAVVAVMLFHQSSSRMPGGFLGVDLFFVLSGYLITSLLLVEVARARRIDLLGFWGRRARRLLPALFVMIAIYVAFVVFVNDPIDQYTLRGGLLSTLFFVKNYWDIHRRYVSQPAHTWTLSVEEQFYVVWPIALTALLWLRRRWRGALYAGIVVLMAGSACAMWFERAYNAQSTSLESRAQTLLLGALIAVALRDLAAQGRPLVSRRTTQWALELAGIAALVAVCAAFAQIDFYKSFHTLVHGGYLAFGAVGAVLVIAASQPGSVVLGRVLSLGPLRFVGRLSYGLYLFHLPIFFWLDETRTGLNGASLFALRFAVTMVVATASYYLIERPIRERRLPRFRLALAGVAAAVAAVVAISVTTVGMPALASGLPYGRYDLWVRGSLFGRPGFPRVLIAGDAIGGSLQTGPLGALFHHSVSATVSERSCPIEDGSLAIAGRSYPNPPYCASLESWFATARRAFKPDVVVLSVGATQVANRIVDGQFLRVGSVARERAIDRALDRARAALTGGRIPMVVTTVPCTDQLGAPAPGTYLASLRNAPLVSLWLDGVFVRYAAQHPGAVKVLDLRAAVCPGGRVGHASDGTPYVLSNGAFTREGSTFVLKWFDAHVPALIHG